VDREILRETAQYIEINHPYREGFAAHIQNCLIDGRHEQIRNRVRVALDILGNYAGEQSPEECVTPFQEESALLRRDTIPDIKD
jgi:hypothetical protein